MKRVFSIFLIICLMLTLVSCGRRSKEETGLLKIGVLEPLSGKYAAEGMRETLGVQYANNEQPTVRLGGKTYRIELMIRDDASDPAQAELAAQELVDGGCSVVIGSYGDELSKAASGVFLAAGVPAIAATCSDASLTRGNDHYFRIGALPELQGSALAAYAKKTLGLKSVYCLACAGNETDSALMRAFREKAQALELRVVETAFPENNADFTPFLEAAKDEGCGAIFAPCELRYAQRLIEQAAQAEDALPFLADARWRSGAVLEALQETELAIYISAFYSEGADGDFDKGFKGWLKDNVDALTYNGGTDFVTAQSVLGCDAYFTALSAAEKCASADKADILAILPSVSRSGSSGSYSFDEDGGAMRDSLWIEKADLQTLSWTLAGAARF